MPFVPGKSGNPGGKSKEREALRREVQNYFAHRSMHYVESIEEMADHAESEKVRLSARIWLAEQAVGKAAQAITGADGAPLLGAPGGLLEVLKKLGERG